MAERRQFEVKRVERVETGMKKILLLTFEYPVGKRYCGGVGHVVKQCRVSLLALGGKNIQKRE